MFDVVVVDEFFGIMIVSKKDTLLEIKDEWVKQQSYKRGLYNRLELRLNGEALEIATWNKEKKVWDIEIA